MYLKVIPIEHTIETYSIYYYEKKSNSNAHVAGISFYNNQNQYLGNMSFFKEGKRLSNNYVHENFTPKRIFIMAHENQMPGVVDMLRNENPSV